MCVIKKKTKLLFKANLLIYTRDTNHSKRSVRQKSTILSSFTKMNTKEDIF